MHITNGGDNMVMYIVWAAIIILFAVLEIITSQLLSIWFVLGAIGGLIAALCGGSTTIQVVVFIAVTVIALIATRPIVKKHLNTKVESTNADRCIGQDAVVIEQIDNLKPCGQVKVNGTVWTARSGDNTVIPTDTIVTVEKIDGVKLIVKTK